MYNNICTVFFSFSGWLFSFSRFGGENKGGRRGNKREIWLRQVEEELSPFKKTHTEKASLSVGSFFSPSSGS